MESDSDCDIFLTQSTFRDVDPVDYDTEDAAEACLQLEYGALTNALPETTNTAKLNGPEMTGFGDGPRYSDISDEDENGHPLETSDKPSGDRGTVTRFADAKTDQEMESLGRRR